MNAFLDLAEIKTWLAICGPCDAGYPTTCSHPSGDYRVPMLRLVHEVERLRCELAQADLVIASLRLVPAYERESDEPAPGQDVPLPAGVEGHHLGGR